MKRAQTNYNKQQKSCNKNFISPVIQHKQGNLQLMLKDCYKSQIEKNKLRSPQTSNSPSEKRIILKRHISPKQFYLKQQVSHELAKNKVKNQQNQSKQRSSIESSQQIYQYKSIKSPKQFLYNISRRSKDKKNEKSNYSSQNNLYNMNKNKNQDERSHEQIDCQTYQNYEQKLIQKKSQFLQQQKDQEISCNDHPKQQATYYLDKNKEIINLCSNCAIKNIQNGNQVHLIGDSFKTALTKENNFYNKSINNSNKSSQKSLIYDENQNLQTASYRNTRLKQFMDNLIVVKNICENVKENLDQSDQYQKNIFDQQLGFLPEKKQEVYKMIDGIFEQNKTLLKNLNLQNSQQLSSLSNQMSQNIAEINCIYNDIQQNKQCIVYNMSSSPFDQILLRYEEKIEQYYNFSKALQESDDIIKLLKFESNEENSQKELENLYQLKQPQAQKLMKLSNVLTSQESLQLNHNADINKLKKNETLQLTSNQIMFDSESNLEQQTRECRSLSPPNQLNLNKENVSPNQKYINLLRKVNSNQKEQENFYKKFKKQNNKIPLQISSYDNILKSQSYMHHKQEDSKQFSQKVSSKQSVSQTERDINNSIEIINKQLNCKLDQKQKIKKILNSFKNVNRAPDFSINKLLEKTNQTSEIFDITKQDLSKRLQKVKEISSLKKNICSPHFKNEKINNI